MLDTVLHGLRPARRIAACVVTFACSALMAGCDDAKDDTALTPRAGSGGAGAGGGGVAGTTAGTGGARAGAAGEGTGGTETEARDAGADAQSATSDCVVGTLEQYCSVAACPAFEDARSRLRFLGGVLWAQVIVQRPCTAPSGAARVSVSADYQSMSLTYIYDAASEALVGVEFIDDLGPCSGAQWEVGDPGFGSVSGYYGEASPDCGSGFPEFEVPSACGSFEPGAPDDAGPDDAGLDGDGPDAGSVCILTR